MVDVFISYSRDNKARVADIAAAVAAAGYDVWWDAELPPHRSYGDVITEKIGSAKAAIVVWSHTSAASEWVRAEADVARNQKKLIQTAIDDVMPPLPFNQIQFADLRDWNGDPAHGGWRKVLMSLEELCGRGAVSPPPQGPTSSAPARLVAAEPPAQPKSSFLPWALLGVALVVAVLLAWKLIQPASMESGSTAAVSPDAASAASAAGDAEAPAAPATDGRTEAFTLAAVIDDPEGFTNIRSERSAKSEILGKVLDGETFLTYRQPGAWWRVRKADGTTGFMFRKYIRLIDGAAPAIPAGSAPAGVGGSGVVIPDSSDRMLSADELGNYSALELRIARNEIFARHGFRFSDPSLRAHFGRFDWYRPTADTVSLSATEKANIALLKSAEAAAR